MKERFKTQKGITLTALVITIIVMLVLVGVIIVASVAENGIIDRATEAIEKNEKEEIQEIINVSMVYKPTAAESANSYLDMKETADAIVKNLAKANYQVITSTGTVAKEGKDIYTAGESFDLNIKGKKANYTGVITKKGLEEDLQTLEKNEDFPNKEENGNTGVSLSDLEAMRKYFITGNSVIEKIDNPGIFEEAYVSIVDIKFKNDQNTLPDAYTNLSVIDGINVGDYFMAILKYKNKQYTAQLNGDTLVCHEINEYQVNIPSEEEIEETTEVTKKYDEYLQLAKQKGQVTDINIGIGTDGEVVNLDLWYYELNYDRKSYCLGKDETSTYYGAYKEENLTEDGKIQGKMPQYIYNKNDNKIYPVTRLNSMFGYRANGSEEIPEIPATVQIIGSWAFRETKLKSITIPENVIYIDSYAFRGCKDLKEISLPDGLVVLGNSCMMDCSSLESVTLPNSLLEIGYSCFYNCTSLKDIKIPSKIKNIGSQTFYNCTNLSIVYLEQTEIPTFKNRSFWKDSGSQTTFYFKNKEVSDALTTEHYNASFGIKSTDYTW